jgi:hypothetical protein
MVSDTDTVVSTPSTTQCARGGISLPMPVSVDNAPFNDITIGLERLAAADDGTSDSDGLTPPELPVTLDKDNRGHLLVVACADNMVVSDTATLDWVLGGTDEDNFVLENTLLTVTA